MGVPFVNAPCEAEAQCAELAEKGKVRSLSDGQCISWTTTFAASDPDEPLGLVKSCPLRFLL
jgi:XPG I-region